MSDAITRISFYFPTGTLTTFQIIANLVINDVGDCAKQERQLMIALIVIFSLLTFFVSFTDTYTASNGVKFWVLILPGYGPLCFSLPSNEDKDRVYDHFYPKIRDYVHAVLTVLVFLLISLFTNPICMCVFPSGLSNGTSRFDPSIIRTVPVVVSLIASLLMVCLGPPRQMLGYQNVPETCPPEAFVSDDNPVYVQDQYNPDDNPDAIEEGSEGDQQDVPQLKGGGPKGGRDAGYYKNNAGQIPQRASMQRDVSPSPRRHPGNDPLDA